MLLMILKILFAISAIAFSGLVIFHKKYTSKEKDNIKISNFVATMAIFLSLYIICAAIILAIYGGLKYKVLMLMFLLSPFIIGKFATYQKIKLYSIIQIMIMLVSSVIVCIK